MPDEISYENCPYCHSTLIEYIKKEGSNTILVMCRNTEDCGVLIDRQVIESGGE